MVQIETKEAISSSFPRDHGDNDEIICKHKMLKFLGRLLLNPRTRLRDKALLRITEIVCEVRRKSKEKKGSPCLTPFLLEN